MSLLKNLPPPVGEFSGTKLEDAQVLLLSLLKLGDVTKF